MSAYMTAVAIEAFRFNNCKGRAYLLVSNDFVHPHYLDSLIELSSILSAILSFAASSSSMSLSLLPEKGMEICIQTYYFRFILLGNTFEILHHLHHANSHFHQIFWHVLSQLYYRMWLFDSYPHNEDGRYIALSLAQIKGIRTNALQVQQKNPRHWKDPSLPTEFPTYPSTNDEIDKYPIQYRNDTDMSEIQSACCQDSWWCTQWHPSAK